MHLKPVLDGNTIYNCTIKYVKDYGQCQKFTKYYVDFNSLSRSGSDELHF